MAAVVTSIKVPKHLAEKVRAVSQREGYRSVTEFILESVRLRLQEFK